MKVILNVLLMVALLTLSACSPKQADTPKNTEITTATEAKTQTESKTEGQTTPRKKSETTNQSEAKSSVENPLDPSLYAPIAKFEKTVSPNKSKPREIVLKESDITVIANITPASDKPPVPRHMSSLVVTKGTPKFTLPTKRNTADVDYFRDIHGMALSPSHTWLAIRADQPEGSVLRLFISQRRTL